MDVPELAKTGLKKCDEIENAMAEGKMGLEVMPIVAELSKLTDELDKVHVGIVQVYDFAVTILTEHLLEGNLRAAQSALQGLRALLAEEIPDHALAQSYINSAPKIGSA